MTTRGMGVGAANDLDALALIRLNDELRDRCEKLRNALHVANDAVRRRNAELARIHSILVDDRWPWPPWDGEGSMADWLRGLLEDLTSDAQRLQSRLSSGRALNVDQERARLRRLLEDSEDRFQAKLAESRRLREEPARLSSVIADQTEAQEPKKRGRASQAADKRRLLRAKRKGPAA